MEALCPEVKFDNNRLALGPKTLGCLWFPLKNLQFARSNRLSKRRDTAVLAPKISLYLLAARNGHSRYVLSGGQMLNGIFLREAKS